MVRQEGFEPPAYCLEGSCSIQLSYWRELNGAGDGNRTRIPSLEGWCPGHCATPAYALRSNRQLDYISTYHRHLSRKKSKFCRKYLRIPSAYPAAPQRYEKRTAAPPFFPIPLYIWPLRR